MDRQELITRLSQSREKFMENIESLSDEALQQAGVVGEWSIKDILAHLSIWEAEMVKMLWQVQQGEKPSSAQFSSKSVDEYNSQWFEENRSRPLDRVMADYQAVRKQTLRRLEGFSNEELNEPRKYAWLKGHPLIEWIEGDSFAHEEEHAEQIKTWRKENGL